MMDIKKVLFGVLWKEPYGNVKAMSMKQPIISNLILRIENADFPPHKEVEDVGAKKEKIYVKDYDVFLFREEIDVQNAILDAIRIASEVTTGHKVLHISMNDDTFLLFLSPQVLEAMADAKCALEIY